MGLRKRIALYLNNLDEEYQISVYKGIRDEARSLNIDLVCIQGETLNQFMAGTPSPFPSRHFMNMDGVLLLSSVIVDRAGQIFLPNIRDHFHNIPCVSIGSRLFDFPSIIIKSRVSMEQLMHHLIIDHGYRKFLYIGGPANHRDNMVREHVFRRSIHTYQPKFPSLHGDVANGGFNDASGASIIHEYMMKHPDEPLDAVVAANDNMALGALYVLKDCTEPRWKQCAVTGFDDIPQARLEVPALTTVRQPLSSLGRQALQALLDVLDGSRVSGVIHTDSEFVIRNSCGCGTEWDVDKEAETRTQLKSRLEAIQYKAAKSEQYLRNISVFGQHLITIHTIEDMLATLPDYLTSLEVYTFHLIAFPRQEPIFPSEGVLLYQRVNGTDSFWPDMNNVVVLKDFFASLDSGESGRNSERMLYHLRSGKDFLGLIYYYAEDFAQPLICSSAAFLSNTLKRLRILEEEKERSRHLEKEVEHRTRDLVDTNKKLKHEARRRIEVEAEVLRISELERLRFSLDLHDDICQRLAGISMYCKSLATVPVNGETIGEIATMIDETLHLTRQYAHDSFPMELDTLGLQDALQSLCHDVEKNAACICNYSWQVSGPSPLTGPQEINVYRIIQEALQNVIKHSKASMVDITVIRESEAFVIRVKDNGVGAPHPGDKPYCYLEDGGLPQKRNRREGLGMRSMQYRAHQLGAEYIFKSTPGKGTLVEIRIPLKENPESLLGHIQ